MGRKIKRSRARAIREEIALFFAHRATARRIRRIAAGGPRLAVRVTGGMGDQIIAARFIRDLVAEVGPIPVDVFTSSGGMNWIFEAPGIEATVYVGGSQLLRAVLRTYACVLRITHTVDLIHLDRSERFPEALRTRLGSMAERLQAFQPLVHRTIELHPHLDFQIARLATLMQRGRRDFLNEMAGIPYGGDRFALPSDLSIVGRQGLLQKPFITVQSSFEPARGARGNQTRFYPHFDRVLEIVKAALPDLFILQVGWGSCDPLAAADRNLFGHTSLLETAGLMAGALMHFDNEGGIAHVASCLGTPACVLFGPTPLYFAYPGNVNLAPPVCGDCWGSSRRWMSDCVRGFREPICLFSQDPEVVAGRVLPVLRERLAGWRSSVNSGRPETPAAA